MKVFKRLIIIVAAAAIGLLCVCYASREYSISVCAKTGMIRWTHRYGPFELHKTEQTPLSQALVETGYRNPAQHQWIYAHGRGWRFGRTSFTGSGNGSSIIHVVKSSRIALGIRLLITNTDKPTAEKWLRRLFDPETSLTAESAFFGLEEHTNREEFVRWIQEQDAEFTQTWTNK